MRYAAVGIVCLVATGCGTESSKGVPSQYVKLTGVVTYNDEPVQGVSLQFLPDSGSQGMGVGGFAFTDQDGAYFAKYRGETNGLPPGRYLVQFSRYSMPNGDPLPAGVSPTDSGAVESLPAKYTSTSTSGITVEVLEDATEKDFKLKGPAFGKK